MYDLHCLPRELKMMPVHLLESYGVRTLLNRSEEGLCAVGLLSFVRSFVRGAFSKAVGEGRGLWDPVLVSPSFVSAPSFYRVHPCAS